MKVLALIFLIPLAGAAVNGIFWKRLKGNVPGLLASSTVFASFVLTLWALFELSGLGVDAQVIQFSLYEWIGVVWYHLAYI